MNRLIIVLFLLLWYSLPNAQEFSHYDIIDGLSSIEVTDIVENENFMWIATCDGLNRFDGENFKVYKREKGSLNGLTENNIETLFFDLDGLLWIGLKTGGVDIYDPRKDQFMNISRFIGEKVPSRVISIQEDSERNIWLGTWEEGTYKLTPNGNKTYTSEIFCPGYIVSTIIEKPKGFIRIGTYFGFFVYSLKENKLFESIHKEMAVTQFLDTGEKNAIWASTWSSGLLKIHWTDEDPVTMQVNKHSDENIHKSIYRIINSNDNTIYLGTWGEGLKRFDIAKSHTIYDQPTKWLTASLINCLFRDKYNNIWIGTYGGGIFRFNPDKNGIGHFPLTGKLPSPVISMTSLDKDFILLGTQGNGIYLCDLKEGKLIPKYGNSGDGEFNNYILSLYSNRELLFAGHDGIGITYATHEHFNDSDLSIREYFADNRLEKGTAFYTGEDGRIWIGTKQNGLISIRINTVTGKPEDYVHYNSFGSDEINGFAKFDKDHLFVSSHSGLFLFNIRENRIPLHGRIITNEIIYKIVKDEKNKCLWIGTSTNLLRFDLKDTTAVRTAFPQDLLPEGAIRVLTLDSQNNLWFAIGERIFCAIYNENRMKEINPGLLGNHTILSSTCNTFDNRECVVFGTTDNLIIIDPQQVLNQPTESKILFTELQVDHKKIDVGEKVYGDVLLKEATEYVSSIRLSYKCRWISFSFTETGWDFYKNKYKYRIWGFSDTWQYLDLSHPITFSQLNSGEYKLEIKRYDASTDSPPGWSMDIIITPPWWNTIWFYILFTILLVIIAFIAVIMIINYYKKRQLLRLKTIEKQKEEELLREKESFFTGLSHDLLTPFSLILAPVTDLLRESSQDDPIREKLEIIGKNTTFLSDIFGTILDFKKAELTDTQLKEMNVEIVSFTKMVVNAFDYLAKSRKLELTFNSNVELLYILTDNVKVERILYNLVSNAIKYTPDCGEVNVKLEFDGLNNLKIVVRDNGNGIDVKNQSLIFKKFYREPKKPGFPDQHGLGLGLYVARKFIDILGGEVRVNSTPGIGTEIEVRLTVSIIKPEENKDYQGGFSAGIIPEDTSTILLVEDNEQMREYIRRKLAKHFNVITAVNGKEALERIDEHLPEIVITDVMMPEMDGFTLCGMIKENSRYADILVVLLTARSSSYDELQGYNKGADIYIKKPFDSEALLNQMINIQNTSQRRKSMLLATLISKESCEIEFNPKETFLKRSMQVIEDHLMDANFSIDDFASELNLSKPVLHRKFKLLVGQPPNQFIRLVRLRKSVNLLLNSDHTIAEIAYLTGFNQSHYFIKCFREVYDETPKSFRQRK